MTGADLLGQGWGKRQGRDNPCPDDGRPWSDLGARPSGFASIIVVNHNGGALLHACLESLTNDLRPGDEIILVDNASTDGSARAAERAFPAVRVLCSLTNLGFGGGNNLGARHATGEYLAFINPDTVVAPGWLMPLVSALEEDASAGLATSKVLLLQDPSRINTCGNEVHCSGLALCRGMGQDQEMLAEMAEVGAVSGAAFVMRRELFEMLGGFDESFFLYMEDTDLSWRAQLLGYRCLYVPDSVIYHDYALRFGPLKTFYQERNRYLMLLKALRWRSLFVLSPALLLAEIVTWGFVLSRERRHVGNKVRAYGWLVRNWSPVMEKRRQTQVSRRQEDRSLIERTGYRLMYEQTGLGPVARLAQLVFDPTFRVLRGMALGLIRW